MFSGRMRRRAIGLLLALAVLMALPGAALAEGNQGDEGIKFFSQLSHNQQNLYISADQTVKGPKIFSGDTVQIDGTVDGSAVAAGRQVRINGTIKGDLFTFARDTRVNGNVLGNIYLLSQDAVFNGQVTGDMLALGSSVTIEEKAQVGRDALLGAETISHSGYLGRQLFAGGRSIVLNGMVEDNSRVAAEHVAVQDNAQLKGNLDYRSPNQASISSQARVEGETRWNKAVPRPRETAPDYRGEFIGTLLGLAGALVIWLVVAVWRPRFWPQTAEAIPRHPFKTLGVGTLTLIATPIAAVILMITVVGLPLGIILGLAYGVSLYLAKIVVAVFVGHWLALRFGWPEIHRGVWLVLLGLALIAAVTKLPVVGFFAGVLVVFAGLGALVLTLFQPAPREDLAG